MVKCLDYLDPKTYNTYFFVPLVFFVLLGSPMVPTPFVFLYKESFHCVDKTNLETEDNSVRNYVNSKCSTMYNKKFHLNLTFIFMFPLNFVIVVLVSIIYTCLAKERVEGHERCLREMRPYTNDDRKCLGRFSTLFIYVAYLFVRMVSLLTFTIICFYPTHMPNDFLCPLPPDMQGKWNITFDCTSSVSSKINTLAKIVVYLNIFLIIATVLEFCYLARSIFSDRSPMTDGEFITVYLLRTRKRSRKFINRLLGKSRSEENFPFVPNKTSLRPHEKFNVLIQEGSQFMDMDAYPKKIDRHEIYQSHLEAFAAATKLANVTDILKSEKGEQQNQYYPQIILVTGKPSIGKSRFKTTFLRQSKVKDDEFWRDKMVFLVDKTSTLLGMLRCSKGQSSDYFSSDYYEFIRSQPTNTILLFDELDNQTVESELSREHTENGVTRTDNIENPSTPNNIIRRFKLLVREWLSNGVKILIMSRPTEQHLFYDFVIDNSDDFVIDRTVNILGYSKHEIKEFCQNQSHTNDLIWNQIKGSPELLLSLCHIPGLCDLVCSFLEERWAHGNIRITELLDRAVKYLLWDQRPDDYFTAPLPNDLQQKLKYIKKVAKKEFEKGKFVFIRHSTDEKFGKIANSGLFNKFPAKSQHYFCFLDWPLQAFLVASDVVDKNNVQVFLQDQTRDGPIYDNAKFVIQLIAGLLGEKRKEPGSETDDDEEESKRKKSDKDKSESDKDKSKSEGIFYLRKRLVELVYLLGRGKEDDENALFGIQCLYELDIAIMEEVATKFSPQDGKLSLEGLNITSVDCTALFEFLANSRNVKELEFNNCQIQDNYTYYKMGRSLFGTPGNSITSFSWVGNLTDEGVEYLSSALKDEHCKLTEIKLILGNQVTDQAVEYLCDALKDENCQLKKLLLRINVLTFALSDTSVKYVNEAIRSKNCKLDALLFEYTKYGYHCIEHLCTYTLVTDNMSNSVCRSLKLDKRDKGVA